MRFELLPDAVKVRPVELNADNRLGLRDPGLYALRDVFHGMREVRGLGELLGPVGGVGLQRQPLVVDGGDGLLHVLLLAGLRAVADDVAAFGAQLVQALLELLELGEKVLRKQDNEAGDKRQAEGRTDVLTKNTDKYLTKQIYLTERYPTMELEAPRKYPDQYVRDARKFFFPKFLR